MKIIVIDHNFYMPKVIASYLIETNDGPILIETGPDSTFRKLSKSLDKIGYPVENIKHVFVTHIHLDHSGSAWHFAKAGATVYVHQNGARHLVDPSKLIESARRIYKDQMDELWGETQSIPEERVRVVSDGDTLRIGGVEVRTVETLGHASHHNAYVIEDTVFMGDLAGIRIEGGPVLPPTPPPDINVEAWQHSLNKIRELSPKVLYPTHFGKSTDIKEHLEELETRLLECTEWIGTRVREGKTEEEMIPEFEDLFSGILEEAKVSPELIKSYELADPFYMNVGGLVRYWKKFRLPS